MSPSEVQRALRIITSPAWKRTKRFPITVLANLANLSRETVYQARNGQGLTKRVVNVLSPLLTDIVSGRITAEQTGRTWSVRNAGMEERRFFGWLALQRVPLGWRGADGQLRGTWSAR